MEVIPSLVLKVWRRETLLLQALADGGGTLDMLQMIDSTIVRAHRCAASWRKDRESKIRHSVVRAVGSAPRSMCAVTPQCLPIGVAFSQGEAHEVTAYDGLMKQRDSDPGAMLADKGDDSDTIRHDSARQRRDTRDPEQEQPQRLQHPRSANPSMRRGHGIE